MHAFYLHAFTCGWIALFISFLSFLIFLFFIYNLNTFISYISLFLFLFFPVTGPIAKECADQWPRVAAAAGSVM
jgi:hypothetical protein